MILQFDWWFIDLWVLPEVLIYLFLIRLYESEIIRLKRENEKLREDI